MRRDPERNVFEGKGKVNVPNIALLKSGKRIRDVWVTDDIDKEPRYKEPDEDIDFSYWDGTVPDSSA
jgi:hypothetical protein